MISLQISLLTFACTFGCTLLGMFVRRFLPEHHLTADSRDVMKLGTGMIATLAALVLGLLISSAKGTFDTLNNAIRQTGSLIVVLDRTMARYGPETKDARDVLHTAVQQTIERVWGVNSKPPELENAAAEQGLEVLYIKLEDLTPQNDAQRRLLLRAVDIIGQIEEIRLNSLQRKGESSFPMLLVGVLICWLTIIFFSFGLLSTPNRTTMIVLFICALATTSSLFLLQELDQPFGGMIRVSSAPLQKALIIVGR